MTLEKLADNRAVKMLNAAAEGKYGVLGVVSYNLETIVAVIKAAEAKKSPVQILLFPWALQYSPLFIDLAANAARKAKVPVTVHMDHAQDPEVIKIASQIKAADGTPAFDSIMVDMSHYEKEENLAKTKELVALCHSRGIATEAEPGRIEGGEDGVKDTAELEGMMTTEEEVDDFIATGIDFLAPAFGNVHGDYHGVENIHLDYDRLETIQKKAGKRVQIVLHGTNEFPEEVMAKCIERGVTRINVNKLVLSDYNKYVEENTGKVPLTQLMETGTSLIQKQMEGWMDAIGSSGKA
ncbi:probable fructose-bisphosphate aldolase [Ramularia collo-cygni]|uniref:Fructose-bisphosphate aldolase n=1 Tax=Ramularia collo-cygni TaxID=112498 RepID=A0A2D3VAH8_9PEZI|nr:probable fructose-bisphosphate aldolase [Ramularia collo-cygni]CZT20666.1 probable fructose-bisphosphate aldolase [Ramularia collo-cygni]